MDLSGVERRVARLQKKLIWFRGHLGEHIRSEPIIQYAAALARHYLPKRADNADYMAPVVHAFACDLVVAPILHRYHHLWRYDYDDLDILAQFYTFSTPSRRYYHLATGESVSPTIEEVRKGCHILGVDLGEHLDELFTTYRMEGARSRVAARVIESLGGICSDRSLNDHYGFLEPESHRRLRALRGLGRFRFLRRGRQWMAIGTSPGYRTIDIRREAAADIFGYKIQIGAKNKVYVSLSKQTIDQARAEIAAMLESETRSALWQINQVSNFYRQFHHQRRFANAVDWIGLDRWVIRRVRRFLRQHPKIEARIYQASKNTPGWITYLPRRSNFFWNVAELNCEFVDIWNPYRWPEPDRRWEDHRDG